MTIASEDTAPIQISGGDDCIGTFGLWRLFEPGLAPGHLVRPMGRVVAVAIGRGDDITDQTVSRRHCSISLTASGIPGVGPWQVQDLGARNGTWVDTERLAPGGIAEFHRGQTLRLGSTLLWLGDGVEQGDTAEHSCFPGFSQEHDRLNQHIAALSRSDLPIVVSGPANAGRRLLTSCYLSSLPADDPVFLVLPDDLAQWRAAVATPRPPGRTVTLVCGALEALPAEVQTWLADELQLQAAQRARGVATNWRLVAWTGELGPARPALSGRWLPGLARQLEPCVVRLSALNDHRQDIPCLMERLRSRFGVPTLRELSLHSLAAGLETCAQVQRWVHQSWPGGFAELVGMALPEYAQSQVMAAGLSGRSGLWSPQPMTVPAEIPAVWLLARRPDIATGAAKPSDEAEPAPTAHEPPARGFGQVTEEPGTLENAGSGPSGQHRRRRKIRNTSIGFDSGSLDATAFANWSPLVTQRDGAWFLIAMGEQTTLYNALVLGFDSNIRAFCEEAARMTERNPESVRRQVYRVLGDALAGLRR